MSLVRSGELWLHERTNTLYKIILLTNVNGRNPSNVQVVYRDAVNRTWSKPLEEFRTKFVRDSLSEV